MAVHLLRSGKLLHNQKSVHKELISTTDPSKVTCKVCKELLYLERGGEYKCGGAYDGQRKKRVYENQWGYKEENRLLKKRLDIAEALLTYYADKKTWRKQSQTNNTICGIDDMEKNGPFGFGGKKARDYFAEFKE